MSQVKENSVQLQIGEYYLRRNGKIAGPVMAGEPNKPSHEYIVGPWSYYGDGRLFSSRTFEDDLVEHIPLGDPRHPNFTPASKIPGMTLQRAVVIEPTQEQLGLLNLVLSETAITEKEAAACIEVYPWPVEPLPAVPEVVSIPIQTEREWLGNDKPAGEVQADEWPGERWGLVECETTLQDLYCVTLDVSAMDDVM